MTIDAERGYHVRYRGAFLVVTPSETHEADGGALHCASCHRVIKRDERYTFGQVNDVDRALPMCRACRPFIAWHELCAVLDFHGGGWLVWLASRLRRRT